MEVERQKFETVIHKDEKGNVSEVGEKRGKVEKFEFGSPDSPITAVVGGAYLPQFSPDFLQAALGKEQGVCARFYFDRKVVVDIGDPNSKLSKKKRQVLFQNGLAYLCVPENFSNEPEHLRNLYKAALAEYFAYEKLHPREVQTQEMTFIDSDGKAKTAKMRAIDIKVGGGILGSAEEQQKDFEAAKNMSGSELKLAKSRARALKAIRKSQEKGVPFRNPFIGKHGKRLYNVEYAQ